jgi:phospholipid/cholesterol/gamma-HCH transport system substrate-binding protein
MPDTEQNRSVLKRVAELRDQLGWVESDIAEAEANLAQAEEAYQMALASHGEESSQAAQRDKEREDLSDLLKDRQASLSEIQTDISREEAKLQNIQVTMRINSRHRDWIRADSNISLGSIGLLGDKYIEISLGRSDRLPPTEHEEVPGWFGPKMREVVMITGTQQASFAELITGANDILANFQTLSSQAKDIMRGFEAGEGAVGRFLTDPSFYNNLNRTVADASLAAERLAGLLDDIRSGSGSMTKLIQDDEAYDKIISSTKEFSEILERINRAEGTLGKFVNDPSVYNRTDQVLASVDKITGRIEAGEGTLGRLTTDEELYVSMRQSAGKLASILKEIEAGKGTLGKLVQEEALYDNLNQLSAELVKFIYDFRQNPKKFLTIKIEIF